MADYAILEITGQFSDNAGAPIDVATVTLNITHYDDRQEVLALADVVHPSTGVYVYDCHCANPGLVRWEWHGATSGVNALWRTVKGQCLID